MSDLHTRMHAALAAAEAHVDPTRPANPAPRFECDGCGVRVWQFCVCAERARLRALEQTTHRVAVAMEAA